MHSNSVQPSHRWACTSLAISLSAILAGCGGSGRDAVSLPAASNPVSAQDACKKFVGETVEGAKVTSAMLVAGTETVPEYCVVKAEMPKDLDFEVRMPTDWNHRTVFMGGGGFDGAITAHDTPYNSPDVAKRGYATIATNHGHNEDVTPGAEFALDEGMLLDYAYRSVPRVLAPAKAILKAHYGSAFESTRMVYEGCSGGGRQALIQAQRHPDLFDGIISRAPANAYIPQFLWYQKMAKQQAKPGAILSDAKVSTVSAAAIAKCDALDGLADGVIGRPEQCTFDPAELTCTGAENDACLTPPQVETAQAFYAPTNVANGRYVWPGFTPGGEEGMPGWPNWSPESSRSLMEGFIKYMVAQNGSTDPLQLDPTQYTSRIDQLATMIDAVDPDLGRFRQRGGKLILWTGQSDWLITANNATSYYQSVVKASGSQKAADEFVEYYTSPGVQHCAFGSGADSVDLVGPMFDWLEKEAKPSSKTLVATQMFPAEGAVPKNRPVCQYPKFAKYVGGDVNAASSFQCTAP